MYCCICYTTTGLFLLFNRSFRKYHTLICCGFYHAIILFLCKSDEKYHSCGWSLWVVGISREKTIVPQTLSKTRFILQTQSIKKQTDKRTTVPQTLSVRLDPSNTYLWNLRSTWQVLLVVGRKESPFNKKWSSSQFVMAPGHNCCEGKGEISTLSTQDCY